MPWRKHRLNGGIAKGQRLDIFQKMVYRQNHRIPGHSFFGGLGQLPVDFGKIQRGTVFFFEIICPAIMISVAMGDHDGPQMTDIQSQMIKPLFDLLYTPRIGFHTIQQHRAFAGLQHKTAHHFVSDPEGQPSHETTEKLVDFMVLCYIISAYKCIKDAIPVAKEANYGLSL